MIASDLRPTVPPSDADDRAFLVAAWITPSARPHATAVRFYLDGRLSVLPRRARTWLEELSRETTARGATARRLLGRIEGGSEMQRSPALGSLWRVGATGNVYRVEAACPRCGVVLRLVQPSAATLQERAAQAELDRQWRSESLPPVEVMEVELTWFQRGDVAQAKEEVCDV